MDKANNSTVKHSVTYPGLFLRGAGQVMFQNNAWCGLLLLAGIFWGSYESGNPAVAWGALVGLAVATATGFLLGFARHEGEEGLWGFNGILVGCAFPTFLADTSWMWFALVLCAALTTWVRRGLNRVMTPWRINSLTFPFVLCTWLFLLAARALEALPTTHMATPRLPTEPITAMETLHPLDLVLYWLRGISQIFLIDSWVTGALFLIGLFIASRWAALWAAVGSAIAVVFAIALGASASAIGAGLYGFSSTLTAIALGAVFYRPNLRTAVWTLLGVLVTLFVQAAMNTLIAPLGIATLTAPFCITTWLFLLPLIRFDEAKHPDHTSWSASLKKHLKN